jgi:superfamily II DNA or RNA helicase
MAVELKIENSYTYVLNTIEESILEKILKQCSFFVKGAQFTPQYANGLWDGRKYLFDINRYRFPTGLISEVIKIIEDIIINDVRVKPVKKFNYDTPTFCSFRDYQINVVDDAVKKQRGIIVVGTGGGKTLIGLKIIYELGVKSLFIVNTKEALFDTHKTALKFFPEKDVGVYGGGKKNFGNFLTIATMASVTSQYKKKTKNEFLDHNFQCLLIDEVHHVGADSWYKAVMDINAYYKFGLTGTNFRASGSLLLMAATGRAICNIGAKKLQALGYLSACDIKFLNVNFPRALDRPLSYSEVYTCGIVKNNYRNNLILELVKKELGKSILIIIEKIDHGEELFSLIKNIDKNVKFIHGKSKNREELKVGFESKKILTVIASRIYQESVDIPVIDVIINAAGGKSGNKVIQSLGRGLRLSSDKKKLVLYDFYDSFNYKLEEHSMERMRWLKKEGHKVLNIDNKKFAEERSRDVIFSV